MRATWALALLLAGCVDAPQAPEAPPAADDDPCAGVVDCPCGPTGEVCGARVDAPDLVPGTAWTYRARSFYDGDADVTIVVASAGPDGYLFAGATPEDVGPSAVWYRDWHGPHGRDLNAVQDATFRVFDWPLHDGKTWELLEGMPVTARAADVPTPSGPEPGFVIEGTRDDERGARRFVAQYAPSLGTLTEYLWEVDGAPFYHLELARVGTTASYVWFERGPRVDAEGYGDPSPDALQVLEVPAGASAVLVSAGGDGGRVAVTPPGAAPWTWEAPSGGESWNPIVAFPATEGRWAVAAAGAAPSWAYAAVQVVTWVEGSI